MNHRQSQVARGAGRNTGERAAGERNMSSQHQSRPMTEDLMSYVRRYAQEKPQSFAMACLGVGFILGWKLKPW